MSKKIVSYPITVPDGNYCWEKMPPYEICEQFDNEGGHSVCKLGFHELKDTDDGVLKPESCLCLKLKVIN